MKHLNVKKHKYLLIVMHAIRFIYLEPFEEGTPYEFFPTISSNKSFESTKI